MSSSEVSEQKFKPKYVPNFSKTARRVPTGTTASRASSHRTPDTTADNETKSSPTILRIKRRIHEDPVQSLVLRFKRFKGENSEGGENSKVELNDKCENSDSEGETTEVVSRLLHFAGTVGSNESKDELKKTIAEALTVATTAKIKEEIPTSSKSLGLKRRAINAKDKLRASFQESIVENRFRLVNCKRELTDQPLDQEVPHLDSDVVQGLYNLYDVVEQPIEKGAKEHRDPRELGAITCNGLPLIKEKEELKILGTTDDDFVFDLYVTNGSICDNLQDSYVSILDKDEEDLRFNEFQNNVESDECDDMEGDDDSNDEDNWRNDYPDSDPDNEHVDNSYYGTGEMDGLGTLMGSLDVDEAYGIPDSGDDEYDVYGQDNPTSRHWFMRRQEMSGDISNEVVSVSEDSD